MKARLKADAEKKHWDEKRRGLSDQTQQLRTECQGLEEEYQVRIATSRDTELTFVQDWLAKAQDFCDRVETQRSVLTIRKEIEGMEQALQAREAE